MTSLYRLLPSVDEALKRLDADAALAGQSGLPRPLVRGLVNEFLDLLREEIKSGVVSTPEPLAEATLFPRLACFVRVRSKPRFTRVLNATGVVIHTNLGRSLLADTATEAVTQACRNYSNLEFNLATGLRGSRYSHVEELLCRITGAEAALVVNNNAAAVLLALETLARGREVVVSRGQLVEIGGSFRIPDVMARSGATLVEVGATNRTHPRDYQQAITENTALLLKVHTSNYRIIGFTRETTLAELVALGREHGLPVMEDLGSGSFTNFQAHGLPPGLPNEPTVQECVAAGADVVTFSGDKVLGGPQAGIIVGRREHIERIKRNPMNRALRIDKMTLAALEATLRLYLDPELARRDIPTLVMITASADELKDKARRLSRVLRKTLGDVAEVRLLPGSSQVGGGSFPELNLPTTLVAVRLPGLSADGLRSRLLATEPPQHPLVGRIESDLFCLDPRTLRPDEFPLAAQALKQAQTEATTQDQCAAGQG